MLFCHSAHVQNGIAHASQCRVDAYVCGVGNLFKRHILIEAHKHYLALRGRQEVHHSTYVGHYLVVDILVLNIAYHQVVAANV